jgi:histidinol-phosphate aminotransferase
VLRTFSKAYGLAGLRVGYAVAREPVATALRKTAVAFGVNSLAEAAAVASLGARADLQQRVDAIVAERARVLSQLRSQGWRVPDAQGNFIWLPLGEASSAFTAAAESAGLAVRRFGDEGVRVTIGEAQANDLVLDVAGSFPRCLRLRARICRCLRPRRPSCSRGRRQVSPAAGPRPHGPVRRSR